LCVDFLVLHFQVFILAL